MGAMDYHKCLACRKGWCDEKTKTKRLDVCEIWKERYPEEEHWYSVRFTDECHYGFGPQETLRILYESLVKGVVKTAYKKAILKPMEPKKGNEIDSILGLVLVTIPSPI